MNRELKLPFDTYDLPPAIVEEQATYLDYLSEAEQSRLREEVDKYADEHAHEHNCDADLIDLPWEGNRLEYLSLARVYSEPDAEGRKQFKSGIG
ncbi:MAG: hypothetical protein AABW80_02870 [Nanoarchaeota archaeon]